MQELAFRRSGIAFQRVWDMLNARECFSDLSVFVFGLLSLKHAFVAQEKQMMVYVERRVADDATLSKDEAFGSIRNQLCTFREGESVTCPIMQCTHKCYC